MRLKNIILADLGKRKLICYEKLERELNSNGDVEVNIINIRKQLKKIVMINAMISEWENIINQEISELKNNKENG